MLKNFLREEDGQDLVEYSLLLAFVAVAAIATLTKTSTAITGVFTKVNAKLNAANP